MADALRVNVKPEQARELARLQAAAQRACEDASLALRVLTLGRVPEGATLVHIDTDAGALLLSEPRTAEFVGSEPDSSVGRHGC